MWIPKTEEEIIACVTSKSLEETSSFDAKKELPSKNQEIAKDIASMTNDGGVIIYGIDEDENNRPCILNPIELAGQPERITSVVQTSIAEPPKIAIYTIPSSDNTAIGYIVVYIPLSERAPHMVVVKGENRYYGRTATGNTPLSEGDVARLYERRRQWNVNREHILNNEIENSPMPLVDGHAYLYLFAKPVATDEKLLEKAVKAGESSKTFLTALVDMAAKRKVFSKDYDPDFYANGTWTQRTEGLLCKMGGRDFSNPSDVIDIQIDFDGSGHFLCGRAAERGQDNFWFFPELVAGNTVRFIVLLGELYSRSQYMGSVDVGVGIIGIHGSVPHSNNRIFRGYATLYDRNEYRRTERISAIEMKNDSNDIAKRMLMPLFDAMSQGKLNPFE